jgi:hypothetical protein
MRLAVVFSVLTWLVLSSVSIAQGVYSGESRVGGGGVERYKIETWKSDTKLSKSNLTKAQLNQIPEGKAHPAYLVVDGVAQFGHHRFEVIELIDDKNTLLLLEKERFILTDYENKKLSVGEMVRLLPAVQVVESQKHRDLLLPTLKLSTMRELADYQKKVKQSEKKKR